MDAERIFQTASRAGSDLSQAQRRRLARTRNSCSRASFPRERLDFILCTSKWSKLTVEASIAFPSVSTVTSVRSTTCNKASTSGRVSSLSSCSKWFLIPAYRSFRVVYSASLALMLESWSAWQKAFSINFSCEYTVCQRGLVIALRLAFRELCVLQCSSR